jgi:hypothetical protein
MINYRSTLVLEATPQAPLPEATVKALIASLETGILKSPYIGPTVSRAQFQERFRDDFKMRDDYNLLSDTLSVVGLWDREQTARIGKAADTELLLSLEAFSVPCDGCSDGDQVAVAGQMVDAKTGLLIWRATLMNPVDRTPQALESGLRDLSQRLAELFTDSLRPKWHRERFKNLDAERAKAPRLTIVQERIDASRLNREVVKTSPGLND